MYQVELWRIIDEGEKFWNRTISKMTSSNAHGSTAHIGSNRNKVKSWFVTFPHSGSATPEIFSSYVWQPRERLIEGLSGCEETHEDGSPHIHMNIKLKHGISKANLLNRLRQKYPNDYKRIDIRPTRQNFKQADYLFKEDLAPYSWENPDYVSGGVMENNRRRRKVLEHYRTMCILMGNWKGYDLDIDKCMTRYDEWIEEDASRQGRLPPANGDIFVNWKGEYKNFGDL